MKDCNVSLYLMYAMERAIYLSEDLEVDKVNTFAMVLSILMDEDSCIQKHYLEQSDLIDVQGLIFEMMNSKETYKKVTGLDYPEDIDTKDDSKVDAISDGKEEKKLFEAQNSPDKSSNENIQVIYLANTSDIKKNINYPNKEYSENLEIAFDDAYKRCYSNGQNYVDEDNLLYSIFKLKDSSIKRLFDEFEIDISDLINILLYNSKIFEMKEDKRIKIPASLLTCCEVLNNKFKKGEVCTILGRDKEIASVWNIFSKKTKRNAILVGDAGVGKTAIVEAITMQIVNENCPKEFKGYNLISLDLTGMVAGTRYRGEFEQKVQQLIYFLKSSSNIILFIDEIHQILGAGSAEASGPDLSGSLKPILARDDVIFVGSTTTVEYERYFSKDPAFKRRFEKVEINEPKLKDVKDMVNLKVKSLSKYHNVKISDDVLEYIIISAKAMNYYGNNPDLTIDLVDRSMAIAKITSKKVLSRNEVDKVYKQNYDMFKSMKKQDKLSTAYHEAGHALLKLLAKHSIREDLKIVSIIPTSDYLGVTISEDNDKFSPVTKDAVLESASMSLAGRVAQEFVNPKWDFGASSDLSNATEIIRKMIIEMGMDENIYTNISLYDYNSNGHAMSPDAVDKVNERIEEVMQKVYTSTKNVLSKNKDKLDIIADLLMKKGIISIDEIKLAFKENGIKI